MLTLCGEFRKSWILMRRQEFTELRKEHKQSLRGVEELGTFWTLQVKQFDMTRMKDACRETLVDEYASYCTNLTSQQHCMEGAIIIL